MIEADIVIIGAGLAGLTLAQHLTDGPIKALILEKSRSPGGRLSTRRTGYGGFDHGAQYLTCRTREFAALVARHAQSGALAEWTPDGKDGNHPWWVGKPGMSALGKAMARNLAIGFQTRATRIERRNGCYLVHSRSGDGTEATYAATRIVSAIPAPQAADLLDPLDPAFSALRKVAMAPCWAAMLAFDRRLGHLPDLTRGAPGDVLSLIARNGSKPGRNGESFVLHATAEWSRANLDADPKMVMAALNDAMRDQTGLGTLMPEPVHMEVHRWRHALVETPLERPFLGNPDDTLFACGDWCLEARAEAAHQSGLALARHIITL